MYSAEGGGYSPFPILGLIDSLGFPEFQVVQRAANLIDITFPKGTELSEGVRFRLVEGVRQFLGDSRDMEVHLHAHGEFIVEENGKKNAVVQTLTGSDT